MSSSSSSSSPKPLDPEGMIAAMKEDNNPEPGSPQEAVSERRTEIPSFGSGAARRGREIMKLYPAKSNKIYTCHFCHKGFSACQALGGHQNAHKREREWDKKRKEMEEAFPGLSFLNPYLDKPHLLLGGSSQDALSNDNHLGITLDPFKRRAYESFNIGPGAMTIVPRVTPTRFFTGNTSTFGSSSRGLEPIPSYPLIPKSLPTFPPPRTTSESLSQENGSNEENLISKIGKVKIVEIDDDDDDQPEQGNNKSWGTDLSLSF